MVHDKDGSLTGTGVPTWITPYYPHFDKLIAEGLCSDESGEGNKFNESVIKNLIKNTKIPLQIKTKYLVFKNLNQFHCAFIYMCDLN